MRIGANRYRSSFINRLLYVVMKKIKIKKKEGGEKNIIVFIYTMHFLFFFNRMLNNDRGEKKGGRKWVREGCKLKNETERSPRIGKS